ncbi:MAG: acetate--CoA ligase family protein [Sedimentisphaerales bacterium]|jgi:acetyl coenzyme A synthetase (ADP forming)-like protein
MLHSLLHPGSVAVIGASRTPGKVGHEITRNLLDAGFEGEIVPINPFADQILGLKCYEGIGRYPGKIDLSLIAVRAPLVLDAVISSIQARAGTIVVTSSGFAEVGSRGAEIQRQIAKLCADSKIPLLGPNCFGIINTSHCLNASFSKHLPKPGGISVLSQSGSLCSALLEWASAHGLGLAKVVSLGNKADLNEVNFLESFANDDETTVVVGYLESISSGKDFLKAARRLTSSKPFILLRAGITKAGIWAASAHTGTLAGADAAYAAAFKHTGVIRVESLDGLLDCMAALSTQVCPKADRVAVITNAGGPAVLAADAVEQFGMKLANIRERHLEILKKQLPPAASAYNPIDVLGDADPKRYSMAVEAAQGDDQVDAVIVILTPHSMTQPAEIARSIARRANTDKPILMVLMGSDGARIEHIKTVNSQLPIYPSPGRAVAALSAMWQYQRWRSGPERIVTRFPVNRRPVERIIMRHRKAKLAQIGEAETKEILRAYDFTVPDGRLATSAEEAVDIAKRIGLPVAMKIVSLDVLHKSDVGGIKVGISSSEEVRDAFDLLSLRVGRRAPQARLNGIYVEKMTTEGLHTVMGMVSDPRFGPILMFGVGGTFVDRLDATSYYLAPITADDALRMLSESRSYALLKNARGQADVDLAAIVTALQRTSQLAMDFPHIKELSIDPFIVGRTGMGGVVVDARISLSRTNGG